MPSSICKACNFEEEGVKRIEPSDRSFARADIFSSVQDILRRSWQNGTCSASVGATHGRCRAVKAAKVRTA